MTSLQRQDGLVIIAVLWICALILWFALQLAADTHLQGDAEVHALRRSQAMYLAVGGANTAIAHMGQAVPLEAAATSENSWLPNGDPHTVAYRFGQAEVTIEKETDKVNVNKADHTQLQAVLEKAGVQKDPADRLADRIEDFRDQDNIPQLHGAEKEQYQQMGLHYPPFDGPVVQLDQLLLIPGINSELFFQYGRQPLTAKQGADTPALNPLLPGKDSLFELFTVYGNNIVLQQQNDSTANSRTNVSWEPDGIYRILSLGTMNSGPPSVLLCLIVRYAPETRDGYQILYRKLL